MGRALDTYRQRSPWARPPAAKWHCHTSSRDSCRPPRQDQPGAGLRLTRQMSRSRAERESAGETGGRCVGAYISAGLRRSRIVAGNAHPTLSAPAAPPRLSVSGKSGIAIDPDPELRHSLHSRCARATGGAMRSASMPRRSARRRRTKKKDKKTEGNDLPGDRDGDAYRKLMSTPAAQAYVRDKLTGMIKARLQQAVLPQFQGTRPVRLEIEVHSFIIPSPLMRIAFEQHAGDPDNKFCGMTRPARAGRLRSVQCRDRRVWHPGVAVDRGSPTSRIACSTSTWRTSWPGSPSRDGLVGLG